MREYANTKMRFCVRLLSVAVATMCLYASCCGEEFEEELEDEENKWPTIGISILVRNKHHSLPSVLSSLERQKYSKDRLYVWFYLDNNLDDSKQIIDVWVKKYKNEYNNIYVNTPFKKGAGAQKTSAGKAKASIYKSGTSADTTEAARNISDAPADMTDAGSNISGGPTDRAYSSADQTSASAFEGVSSGKWTEERLKHIIELREKAITFAKQRWADYLFMLDADVLLTDPEALMKLVRKNLSIVAPMLASDGLYSNFWGAMSSNYYYERSDNYEQMNNREIIGCFQVPMVHSAVLIDMRLKQSELLTYDPAKLSGYDGPVDDIIVFARSAIQNGISMTVCNDRMYGFVPIPVDMSQVSLEDGGEETTETEQFVNLKLEALGLGVEIPVDPALQEFVSHPKPDRLGLDRVFMINLDRRPERRRLMELSFKELGIEVQRVKAVDGQSLNLDNLEQLSVRLLPNYEDPYHNRPMKAGEIGCFLSHYYIWKEIAKRRIAKSLVLEDDAHFTSFFRRRFDALMKDLEPIDWDLVYIGRKVLESGLEEHVTSLVTKPLYSYWTLGYLISEAGARKLIQAEPLAKLLPVDEFLPIMFDEHPNDTWKSFFPRRELKAYSASPLLVTPTHYTGERGYVSDTEDSSVVPAVAGQLVDGERAQLRRSEHYEF